MSTNVLHGFNSIHFVHNVQIGTNGYFAFEEYILHEPFFFDNTTNISLVAPLLADFDIETHGQVNYEVHTMNTSSYILSHISALINQNQDIDFAGEWLVVATWEDVTHFAYNDNTVRYLVLLRL